MLSGMSRVLIADNDPDALELALMDLELEGHTVLGARDGETLLGLIDGFGPDVVVLDYRMPPGPTGLDVAARLRGQRPELRMVIYSNYQDIALVERARALGVPFLPKGNLETLRAAVAT
jgi:CheY-like chemotaxis protein